MGRKRDHRVEGAVVDIIMEQRIKIEDMEPMVPYVVSYNYENDDEKEIFMIWKSNDAGINAYLGHISDYKGKLFFILEHDIHEVNRPPNSDNNYERTTMSKVICDNVIGFVFAGSWFYGTRVISDDNE